MEGLELDVFAERFRNANVLVTGHTGFKGSWLSKWLLRLGANVFGLSLDPKPHETLFDRLGLSQSLVSEARIDIRDFASVYSYLVSVQPSIVFHLAAQALVRHSFSDPLETFSTNIIGTANILEAVRTADKPCSVVIVTTDKCYENREWVHSYREEDAMGGHDPYSASKGCAELITQSIRHSYFTRSDSIRVASSRAGNVIGGGDWSPDRIVPDVFRSIAIDLPVRVRNSTATRPWQHVLEPLSGYLWLAALLDKRQTFHGTPISALATAYNFGPTIESNRTVAELVQEIGKHIRCSWLDQSELNAPHEASRLNLAIDKAYHQLRWRPTWDFETAVQKTVEWYIEAEDKYDVTEITESQIDSYEKMAGERRTDWAN